MQFGSSENLETRKTFGSRVNKKMEFQTAAILLEAIEIIKNIVLPITIHNVGLIEDFFTHHKDEARRRVQGTTLREIFGCRAHPDVVMK